MGGSIPLFDEIVLTMGAMNRVLSFDPVRAGPATPCCCALHCQPVAAGMPSGSHRGGMHLHCHPQYALKQSGQWGL